MTKMTASMTDATRTREAITKTIKKIDQDPFVFRTERDLVSMLYCALTSTYPTLYETAVVVHDKDQRTSRVHREYYYGRGTNKRVDLVVLDKKVISKIRKTSLRIEEDRIGKIKRFSDAIEVKAELGGSGDKRRDLADEDIRRLRDLKVKNACSRAHFVYVLRWTTGYKSKQKDMRKLIARMKNRCRKYGVKFYCNRYERLFK